MEKKNMPEKNINLIAIQGTHILTCTYFSYLKHSSKIIVAKQSSLMENLSQESR